MSPQPPVDRPPTVRRALARALVLALCVAAVTAIGAIVTGDFDQTDGRVIATSLGFAVFSATAASGASLRFRGSPHLRALGVATVALSGLSFLLLLVALWGPGDGAWRWFGCAALAALAGSHASLVSGAGRGTDTLTIQALRKASIGLAVLDAGFGIVAVSGAVAEVDDRFGQLLAALVVLLLLATALPPILRRLQPVVGGWTAGPTATDQLRRAPTAPRLAAEMLAVADRIETLNADRGHRAAEIRRECERLRQLARSYGH